MLFPTIIGAQLLFAGVVGVGHLEEVILNHKSGSDCSETRSECSHTCTGRCSIGISTNWEQRQCSKSIQFSHVSHFLSSL